MIDRFERFSLAIAEISSYWHKLPMLIAIPTSAGTVSKVTVTIDNCNNSERYNLSLLIKFIYLAC